MARTHLENLAARQRPNGQIPIVFLDDEERWLRMKEDEGRRQGHEPFMLRRHREGELWNLTPGTRDSEILFIIAVHEHAEATGDEAFLRAQKGPMAAALAHVESHSMKDGLLPGADWRDTMEKELAETPLLTNNCLLHRAYRWMGMDEKAEALQQRIFQVHRPAGAFVDHPGTDRFDPLGGAFAVLHGVAAPGDYAALEQSFRSVDTPWGVTIRCRHNPHTPEEVPVIERTDGVVVWPFVVGFSVLALAKMGARELAREQLDKLIRLDGFWEWYDPATGKGYGAREQLWSAALFLRALMSMG